MICPTLQRGATSERDVGGEESEVGERCEAGEKQHLGQNSDALFFRKLVAGNHYRLSN